MVFLENRLHVLSVYFCYLLFNCFFFCLFGFFYYMGIGSSYTLFFHFLISMHNMHGSFVDFPMYFFFFLFRFLFSKSLRVCVFVCLFGCIQYSFRIWSNEVNSTGDKKNTCLLKSKQRCEFWTNDNLSIWLTTIVFVSFLLPSHMPIFYVLHIYIYISLGLFFLKIIHYDYYLASTVIF